MSEVGIRGAPWKSSATVVKPREEILYVCAPQGPPAPIDLFIGVRIAEYGRRKHTRVISYVEYVVRTFVR